MRASIIPILIACPLGLPAQNPPEAPVYRVTVVQSTIKAVNYGRSGPTQIGFRGTVLLPDARGEAKVEAKQGRTEIEAKFTGLVPPTRFGREYMTYVLWAITPEGRPVNLAELVADHKDKSEVKVTIPLQAFGLLITAEPYFAVTLPSNVVAMENVVRPETEGRVQQVDVKYDLLPRSEYTLHLAAPGGAVPEGPKVSLDEYEALLDFYQARHAVQIARSEGADRYAADTLRRAEELLQQAETYLATKAGKKRVVMVARQATQTAQDARAITARRKSQAPFEESAQVRR